MDHDAAQALVNAVEHACHRGIDRALEAQQSAHQQLVDAVADAYHSGFQSDRVAGWLGWSRASYYRFLAENGITPA